MSENHGWFLFRTEVKSWDSTTWFRIWQFQTPAKSGIFKCISWLNGWFFGMVMIVVFWKREFKTYLNGINVSSLRSSFLFCLHTYSLCPVGRHSYPVVDVATWVTERVSGNVDILISCGGGCNDWDTAEWMDIRTIIFRYVPGNISDSCYCHVLREDPRIKQRWRYITHTRATGNFSTRLFVSLLPRSWITLVFFCFRLR